MEKRQVLVLLLVTTLCLSLNTCDTIEPPPDTQQIPTTEVAGPGGPAYLYGFVKDLIHPQKSVTNTDIYIMNHQDYNDTILHIFVNSTDASFKITNMPEGVFDILLMHEEYLCAKIGKQILKPIGNSFYNPDGNGYFNDSTIYIISISDSIGNPNPPQNGLQGYVNRLSVLLKSETPDSIGWQIVQDSGCDTIRVYRYDDPVFDPFENDLYDLRCSNIAEVSEMLLFFNWQIYFLAAGPAVVYVNP